MAYAYYVVNKETGRVVAGNEYREDANDAREDSPLPKSKTQVLTAAGVRRKHGKIVWERGNPRPTRRNETRKLSEKDKRSLLRSLHQAIADLQEEYMASSPRSYPGDTVDEVTMDEDDYTIAEVSFGWVRVYGDGRIESEDGKTVFFERIEDWL